MPPGLLGRVEVHREAAAEPGVVLHGKWPFPLRPRSHLEARPAGARHWPMGESPVRPGADVGMGFRLGYMGYGAAACPLDLRGDGRGRLGRRGGDAKERPIARDHPARRCGGGGAEDS